MRFTWDAAKARANRRDHGVSFETAARVWQDPLPVVLPDRWQDGEERWHAIGQVGGATLLVVVHAYPGGGDLAVRIISARRATPHERRAYEQA